MYVTDRRAISHAAIEKKTKPNGAIAQLGERLPCTQEVGGSIPPSSTKLKQFVSHEDDGRLFNFG